jgi:hypothetical protein
MGVMLVAVLFLLAGFGGIGMLVLQATELGDVSEVALWDLAYMLPNVVAGIALIRGKTWGWILADLLAFTRLFQHGSTLVAMLGTAIPAASALLSAHLTGMAIWGSLLTYLFKAHVMEYFRVPREKRLALLGGLAVVSLLLLMGASTLRKIALD